MAWRVLLLAGLLGACTEGEAPDDDLQAIHPPEIARIVPANEALAGVQVRKLDPATINDAEIGKALPAGPRCDFHYTSSGRPVLAVHMQPDGNAAGAIVKLNGHLVPLEATRADADQLEMRAEPVRIVIQPDPRELAKARPGIQRREANMIFEVGKELRAGYRGYLDCPVPSRKS
ncbi:MAG TPA: DUF6692 family protein [Burkholderiales bacterium]|nr:DUF6692 family protein [Burkholderiales bacterium]